MDVEIGRGVVNAGKDYVNKGIQKVNLSKLHPYFNVDNTYIIQKILLIIFPFKSHYWQQHKDYHSDKSSNHSLSVQSESLYQRSQSRLTNPDLYIPMMGLFTYILVVSINLGFQAKFTPETITKIFIKCLTLEIVITAIVKLISYLLGVDELGVFDFLSYSGYKFIVILLIQLLCNKKINAIFGPKTYRFLKVCYTLYFYSAFFFFLSRSLKVKVLREGRAQRRKKIYFLFITVFLELVLVFFLS